MYFAIVLLLGSRVALCHPFIDTSNGKPADRHAKQVSLATAKRNDSVTERWEAPDAGGAGRLAPIV